MAGRGAEGDGTVTDVDVTEVGWFMVFVQKKTGLSPPQQTNSNNCNIDYAKGS
eukprot:m.148286 g.148286  ORF g.148286 m.148286 type:complete len:53 (-) comp17309_c0_seq6:1655-1813(-)